MQRETDTTPALEKEYPKGISVLGFAIALTFGGNKASVKRLDF